MTEQTGTRAEGTRPYGCMWPECAEPVAERGDACGPHRAEWDATASAETWGIVAETVEALAKAMHAGLGLPQLDEVLEGAVRRARTTASFYETEAERIEREIAEGRTLQGGGGHPRPLGD
jgi:hypothetical protein